MLSFTIKLKKRHSGIIFWDLLRKIPNKNFVKEFASCCSFLSEIKKNSINWFIIKLTKFIFHKKSFESALSPYAAVSSCKKSEKSHRLVFRNTWMVFYEFWFRNLKSPWFWNYSMIFAKLQDNLLAEQPRRIIFFTVSVTCLL